MATYGKKIYIFGGYNENGILDIVEEYDTTTGICTEKTSLPIKTRGLQALSIDGKIYLFCGTTFDGTTTKVTNAVDRYDPQTNTYLSIEADKDPNDNIVRLRPLQYARTSFGAVAAFGRAFIAAGNDGTKCIGAAGEYVVNQIKGTTFGADYNGTEGRGTQYDSNGANVLTGNYLTQSVDISLEGPYMNVEVVRSYNSSDADTEDELVIGNGWRMSFETFIKKVDSNTYRVKASSLNLRKAPSNIGDAYPTDWPIIRGIANGTILRHTGRVINWPGHSDWYEVITPNNQTGWVCAYYLEKVPGIEVTYPTGTKIVFTADGANYKAPVGCFDELTKTTVDGISMYKLKKKDQTVYLYYADTGKLAYQEDRYGNRIKFYYENGKLKKIFDCDATGNEIGRTLTLEYEGGKLKSISDKAGRSVTYSYTDGKLTSVKNLNDKVTKYEYYNEGEGSKNKIKTIKKVDDNNNEIALYTNFYDGLGRIIKQVDSNNKASYYLYTDLSIDDTSEMTTNGLEVSRQYYNRRGDLTKEIYNINFPDRPIRVIDPIEKVTETKYYLLSGNNYVDTTYFTDQMLRKEENRKLWENNLPQKFETAEIIETENGKKAVNKTIIETDEKSNVILVKNPDDTVKRYKYYENGDLQYVIDEMNYLTYYYYETLGNDIKRLKNIIKPVLPVDPENPIKNVTDVSIFDKDKTAITTYEYEDTKIKSLVKKIINPNGTYTEYEYYDNGMLKSSSNGINTLQYTYDNCFRVESETTDLGNKTIYEYDKMNNITKITRIADGEEPSITRMFYDYDGRKKQEINSLMYDPAYDNGTGYSGTVSDLYDYDAYGRLLKHTQYVKNVDGSVNSYVYSYTYDGEGNLEKEINPSGGTYVYNYDGLGRVTAIYFGSTLLEKYTYNEYVNLDNGTYGTEKVQTKYLSSYKENNQTKYKTADTKYLMDYAGRIVKVTNPTEGDVEEFTKTEYYKDGKVRKVTDPRGNSTYYTYNKYDSTNPGMVYDEKFVPVTEVNGNIKYSYSKTTYDLSGRKVAETTYADLVEITEGDDGKISIKVKDESTEVRYIETKYEYYDNNKVKRISSYGVDTANTPIKSTMEKVTEYRYDKDGNLVEEKAIFDSDKQNINVYLDYNMYGKPQKTAVLISNEDLEKDLYVNEREKITAYSDLFTESTKNENYGYNPDYENYSAIVTTYTNFDKAGNPGTVISPNTQTVKYYYDSLGRVGKQTVNDKDISDINGSGFETTIEKIMTYNWEGKVTGTSVYAHNETGRKLLSSEQNQYNSRGLLEKTIQKGITTKEFNRNTNKETVKTQDLTTAYEYDLAGRVVAEVTPENYVGYKDGQGLLATGTTNKIEYIYDKQGRLILKAFRGKIKNYNGSTGNFNENERYIVIEAYKYDANGNVIKKVDGEAYNKAYEDAVNQQKSVAVEDLINDAYGVEYTYNLANQLETVKNPEFTGANGMNFNRKYSYDGLGRVVGETTAHGLNKTLIIENVNTPVQVSGLYYSITKYLYDDVNRKLDVKVIDNVDNPAYTEDRIKTEYYDYAGNIKKTVDANGNETSYEYNSLGLQRSVTYPGDSSIPTNTVVYKYDSMGNLRYQKDSVGNVKEYKYDLFGRVLSEKVYGTEEEDANETEVRYWYDLYGNVKYKIDANNTVTKYEYDELGRLTRSVVDNVKLIDPATGVDSTTRTSTHETLKYYDKNGNVLHEVTKVTEKDTVSNTAKSSYSVNSYEYDGMGRLVSKIDPVGNVIEKINYNRNSAQIESFDGEDHKKIFEYNKDGKLSVTKQIGENGEYVVKQQDYDAKGNVAYVADGRGNVTVYAYDEQDNLTEVRSYEKLDGDVYRLTDTTRYTYDKNGNMKTQEINGIETNKFNYNARNLVNEKEYPGTSGNIVKYEYYANGSLREVTDRKNIKTQYKYNPQGLVTEEKAVQIGDDGTEQSYTRKNYEYDPAGNQLKSVITSSTAETEVVERTYDELGRVKTKAVSNVEGKALYIYDIVTSDGLTAETSIDQKNNITTKVYDKAGRLAFVKNGDINTENIAKYEYYKNGAAKSVIYAGGAREDYKYYKDGRLESLVNKDNSGTEIESYVYTYDENGNMLSKEDKKGKTTYAYDNLNRLKTVNEEYSGKVTEYNYDKLGNRSTETIKENGIIKEEHVYNYDLELNQLKSVIVRVNGTTVSVTRYEYDANGNQISVDTDGKTTTYAYDEFNQLIYADGAKYGYNAEGYRVSKNVNGSLTRYIYEYDKVVLEIDAAGNQVGRNIYGTNLLMRTADGQSYYYMYNGHADVTALINAATGNIDATYYYDAFGNIVESTGVAKDKNSILYAGYQYDKETGLYYLNARMYDPKIARFLQEDTYTGDPNDPLSLNLYTYCANNPLIYCDPTGHGPEEAMFYQSLQDKANRLFYEKQVYETVELLKTVIDVSESIDSLLLHKEQEKSILGKNDSIYKNSIKYIDEDRIIQDNYAYLLLLQNKLLNNDYIKRNKDIASNLKFSVENGILLTTERYKELLEKFYSTGNFKEAYNNELNRRIQNYFEKSKNQVIYGNYTEDVTLLGTGGQIIAGVFNVDLLEDIRDLTYDITHWETSWEHIGGTFLDTMGLVPLIGGVFKNADKVKTVKKFKLKTPSGLRYNAIVGSNNELRSVFAKLDVKYLDTGTDTNNASRAFVRKLGLSTDDAGHGIGKRLGGLGNKNSKNIFPQDPHINRGEFRNLEKFIYEQVESGKNVFIRVVPKYTEGSTRPFEVIYQVRIDGKTIKLPPFPN